ncbi:membrane protein insertase YidC [Levilactobacillus bambusae]|uniref:Membrane protein insertase YidC n=1 Tax=Levilactobacillus bambusae TaxID=2024736 RepID=A0A2V1N1B8_9LACO|nr:membrane protein insertase YidC [Levilactobacillus bambusae]PWG01014.1 OxaA precursor [Levilactobacillus bambusae]
MKKIKRASVLTLLGTLALILSGCVRTKNGKPYGFVYDYLAVPGQHIMEWLAQFFGGSYGWAIIVLTVLVRLVLMPMMVSQLRKSTEQQERMSAVKPQLNDIQRRQKEAQTPEERAAVSQDMMKVYRDNNISMTGGIGCLPLLIQLPIFAALYAAIRYSPELSKSVFFGIPLGKPSILLAILSFLIYLLQGYLSMVGMPEDQRKQMKMMMWLSPVMIFVFTFQSPAGLGLYFFIGGIFACLQTLIINLYRPRIRRQVDQEIKAHPVKVVTPTEPVTPKPEKKVIEQPQNRNRNAGKQHHDQS